jgi:hypothetical protein
MSRVFTLDSFNEEAEKKFGSLVLEDVTFRAYLSLSDSPENDEIAEFDRVSSELRDLYSRVEEVGNLDEAVAAEDDEEKKAVLQERLEAASESAPTSREIRDKTVELLRSTTKNKTEFDTLTRDFSSAQVYTLMGLYSDKTQMGEA